MLNSFLNPLLLVGLAGIILPVIAHLISRKKYDQVDWGAMQFLELDPSAKRKIRLEELLLLMVRMGLIALVAVALARPWISGTWLGGFVSTQSRDVVLVVDGSYSMGWEDKAVTPHTQSLQLARQFLKDLRAGDTLQVVDARESPHVVLPESTRDTYRVRTALNDLPAPSGSADIPAAIKRAAQLLAVGTNLQREIVVFTDLQARGWKAEDEILWARFDDTKAQSTIPPRVWVLDAARGELGKAPNFTIDRLRLSREVAILDSPIKISSIVRYTGGDSVITRKVSLEIDRLKIADKTLQIKLQPNGEATVEFEHRFESAGSHLVSVSLDQDALPGDNRSDAVVTVTESLPVLLVDGDKKLDPTKCETYFATAALAASGQDRPWIKAPVISPDELTLDRLKPMSIVVIANVATLNEPAIDALKQFVKSGRALLFTLGDHVGKEFYNRLNPLESEGLFPGRLISIGSEDGNEKRGIRIASNSLELPWLRPFRADQGGSLAEARWSRWWKIDISSGSGEKALVTPIAQESLKADSAALNTEESSVEPLVGNPVVEARLTTGDPLIVSRRYGRGVTAVFTSSLDADWNTLPAKQDYVPFLHELLFSLSSPISSRNVDVGSPLILEVPSELKIGDYLFLNPEDKPLAAEKLDDPFQSIARLRSTTLPGVYQFAKKSQKPNDLSHQEYFAVNFDRGESDLTQLTADEKTRLEGENRLKFVTDLPGLRQNMFTEDSRVELWWILLYVFLGSLGFEAWMTRRMVHGGYSGDNTRNSA